jgi:hypothetical protein
MVLSTTGIFAWSLLSKYFQGVNFVAQERTHCLASEFLTKQKKTDSSTEHTLAICATLQLLNPIMTQLM